MTVTIRLEERTFCDLWGEMQKKSLDVGLYMVPFTDQHIKLIRIAVRKNKKAGNSW